MKALKYTICSLVLGALAATSVSTAVLYSKVKTLQTLRESTVSADLPQKTDVKTDVKETGPVVREMKVDRCDYNGGDEIKLFLTEEPDMEVVKHYITAEPLESGVLSFKSMHIWNWEKNCGEPLLVIRGDFAYRTNVTLSVRKGLPIRGLAPSTNLVVKALAGDFTKTICRDDERPNVGFADKGRYLPPAGSRSIMLSSINVPQIHTEIRRVPSANIVGLLALEEDVYDKIGKWGTRESFVLDISGEPLEGTLPTLNRLNTVEKTPLGIVPPDGGASNGVFLVSAVPMSDGQKQHNILSSSARHRVVCLSDIGISVRKNDARTDDESLYLYVWATSLTKGTPVQDATVEVFSTANVLIAKGVTDENGWCTAERVEKGAPFAVVVTAKDGSDRSFIALTGSMLVDERSEEDEWSRDNYLATNEVSAFVWTDRGIYRHDEKIFVHSILRNGKGEAPERFPLELELVSPLGRTAMRKTGLFADEFGALSHDEFTVGAELPSGNWTIRLSLPGKDGRILGTRKVKVEEFAPPTIRVKAEADKGAKPADFKFTVSAEHLYGGPAPLLTCYGAIMFEDVPFEPKGWSGWHFGNDDCGLKPTFRLMNKGTALDAQGRHVFSAPLLDSDGKPKAAVKATTQGTVFDPGGRPAVARDSAIIHYYPFYIGSPLGDWMKRPELERVNVPVACVSPDGKRLAEAKRLIAKVDKIEYVYSYRRGEDGWATWNSERVRTTVASGLPVEVPSGGDATFEIPADKCGDYVLTIEDPATGVAFAKSFYLSDWGDDAVRAPLANPTKVSIATDKPFYRVGETPRIVVKSPFEGTALLTVIRDELVHSQVIALTNATSEIVLPPVESRWSPNVAVRISVIAGVDVSAKGLAVRAHGEATIVVRPEESEIPVALSVEKSAAGDAPANAQRIVAAISAPGASRAVVTVVDEGINLLTGEKTPDPIGFFAQPRTCDLANGLFDLYHRILPVIGDDILKAGGVKTGGGFGADLLGRVSPVPTRRFKPLSMWQKEIEVIDGKARAEFTLHEFVGEVRVTAVAYSGCATGAASVRQKVCPNLMMEPDAPRFVALGDKFRVTLPLDNRSGKDTEIAYKIESAEEIASGTIRLGKDEKTVLKFYAVAPEAPGEMHIKFTAAGCGERHEKTIDLPVRPAMPWRETAGVKMLNPGEAFEIPAQTATSRFQYSVSGSPVAELRAAYDWLAEYPHGCLEQTSSRIFPLLHSTAESTLVDDEKRKAAVNAGVARVLSMVRENDFVMWPDVNYAPWDKEVSLYAAHFLVEAGSKDARVTGFLKKWAMSPTNAISAYACHTLALAGAYERDRMYRLYDDRENLDLISRARLARAFVKMHDRKRAEELMKNAASPGGTKEAAFMLLAILELDPDDDRLPSLVTYLLAKRDKCRFAWGTTSENAHALLALGAWYKAHPPKEGIPQVEEKDGLLRNTGEATAFISWKRLDLPSAAEDKDESSDLSIRREYLAPDGKPYDLANAKATDLVNIRLTLKSKVSRDYADLVIEDLFPGAFEPDRLLAMGSAPDWVMRSDARDDRMLVFSEKFHMEKNDEVQFTYPVRVVSPGEFALPGVAVEGMYHPALRARARCGRIVVRD